MYFPFHSLKLCSFWWQKWLDAAYSGINWSAFQGIALSADNDDDDEEEEENFFFF